MNVFVRWSGGQAETRRLLLNPAHTENGISNYSVFDVYFQHLGAEVVPDPLRLFLKLRQSSRLNISAPFCAQKRFRLTEGIFVCGWSLDQGRIPNHVKTKKVS